MMGPQEEAAPGVVNTTSQHQHSSMHRAHSPGLERVASAFSLQQQLAALLQNTQAAGSRAMPQDTCGRLVEVTVCAAGSSAHTSAAAAATMARVAAAAPPLELQYAEPWCVPITTTTSSRHDTAGSGTTVQLLHLSWRRETAAPGSGLARTYPSTSVCSTGVVQEPCLAANAATGSSPSSSSSGSDHSSRGGGPGTSSSSNSSSSSSSLLHRAAPTQLHGLLFDGPQCIADYHWPLPLIPDSNAEGCITAALQLPAALEPQVLQLVLCCDATRGGADTSQLVACARCPVVFLPPAAVQEVQQQLLPAMQHEILEGWAATAAGGAAEGPPGCMPLPLLQAAVWQHWQALAYDLGLVLGLGQRLARHREHLQQQAQQQPAAAAAAAGGGGGGASRVCLEQQEWAHAEYVQRQLLPVVQGFLANQGLPELQGVVERAAAAATAAVAAAAAAAWPPVAALDADAAQFQCDNHTTARAAAVGQASSSSSHCSNSKTLESNQQQEQQQEQQQQRGLSTNPKLTASICWSGLPPPLEQQYVQYKHQQYLWLDRHAACFAVLWVCVLLVRMMLERDVRGSAMYLGYILSKAVPYLTLLGGQVACFQRHREVLISLVSQALCLGPIVVGALLVDPTITLPLIQGWSGASSWLRVAVASLCQRLWATARGAWPQLPALQQLPGWQHAVAMDAAAGRFPAAALQLHQQLARLVVPPERLMRIFWKIHGEYLVLVPMAIPQHVRLWYFVPSMLAEVAGNCYVFSWVFPWWQVVLRFTPALALTIALAWWFDYQARAKFLHHLQQVEEQRTQRLANKLQSLGPDA